MRNNRKWLLAASGFLRARACLVQRHRAQSVVSVWNADASAARHYAKSIV